MARRGKAASRSARQRRRAASQRGAGPRPSPGQPAPRSETPTQAASSTTGSGAATATTGISGRTSSPASQRGSRVNPRVIVAGSSRLSERAIEEYHYVRRDLRNIAVLMAVMALILVISVVVFSALGMGRTA
jgi:hypothetical protein